jgi:hypothetical protein
VNSRTPSTIPIHYWQKLSNKKPENCTMVYGGDMNQSTSRGRLMSWKELAKDFL